MATSPKSCGLISRARTALYASVSANRPPCPPAVAMAPDVARRLMWCRRWSMARGTGGLWLDRITTQPTSGASTPSGKNTGGTSSTARIRSLSDECAQYPIERPRHERLSGVVVQLDSLGRDPAEHRIYPRVLPAHSRHPQFPADSGRKTPHPFHQVRSLRIEHRKPGLQVIEDCSPDLRSILNAPDVPNLQRHPSQVRLEFPVRAPDMAQSVSGNDPIEHSRAGRRNTPSGWPAQRE